MAKDQTKLPLQAALRRYREEAPAFFRIPAHRFEAGVDEETLRFLGVDVFRADLTEAEGLDDLHAAEGVIAEAQDLAADLWGSEECFFLINGSAGGNEAMLLAAAGPGEKILLARNAHASVLQGLILSGAEPVWILPERLPGTELDGPVRSDQIEKALRNEPDCRAVFLTSPTYYGVCSPVREIAEVCRRFGVPLLVDEAHGSHLYFSERSPEGAVAAGADLVVQSLHKTGGSLTQSSLLHVQGNRIDRERLREGIRFVSSTSPSYVLMASLDGARHQMAVKGKTLVAEAEELADHCREKLRSIEGIDVVYEPCMDPLRVVFTAYGSGITGLEMQKELYERGRVSTELADFLYTIAVISWGNTMRDADRLVSTVRKIVLENKTEKKTAYGNGISSALFFDGSVLPETVRLPRDVWYAGKESIRLEDTAGRIAAEYAAVYPPGVPVLCPGERISPKMRDILLKIREEGFPIRGTADRTLKNLRVLPEQQE